MRIPRLTSPVRTYATTLPKRSTPSHRPFLTLDRFIQRQRVIALYRAIVRATNKIPKSSNTRAEMKGYARDEFERYKHVEDIMAIKGYIMQGKTEFEKIRGYVEGLK